MVHISPGQPGAVPVAGQVDCHHIVSPEAGHIGRRHIKVSTILRWNLIQSHRWTIKQIFDSFKEILRIFFYQKKSGAILNQIKVIMNNDYNFFIF